jgi:hypothetical protein
MKCCIGIISVEAIGNMFFTSLRFVDLIPTWQVRYIFLTYVTTNGFRVFHELH